MSGELTPAELADIDDILNDSSEVKLYEPKNIPNIRIKENSKPLTLNTNSSGRFQSKSSLNHIPPSPVKGIIPKTNKKCIVPCIGGPDLPTGKTTDLTEPKFCSNLICVSCDHKVIRFPNYKWAPSTDYLFLRNNYPNTVQKNLIPAPGLCAYCCQCTFCEESSTKQLSSFDSTWACRGH